MICKTLIQAEAQNKEEESSAIEYYFQLMPDTLPDGSPALKDTTTLDLMSRLIAEPAFDVLRTKEQLGYVQINVEMPSALYIHAGD